ASDEVAQVRVTEIDDWHASTVLLKEKSADIIRLSAAAARRELPTKLIMCSQCTRTREKSL
ncbi:MAG: hypothetical protein JSV90_08915, partial [Methanobacteriota archaeon]